MIKELTKLANHLDAKGLRKEADYLDTVIKKMSNDIRRQIPGKKNISEVLKRMPAARLHPILGAAAIVLGWYFGRKEEVPVPEHIETYLYEVKSGDTLMDIAKEQWRNQKVAMHNWTDEDVTPDEYMQLVWADHTKLYDEILNANNCTDGFSIMPNCINDPNHIEPGWVLHMPTKASRIEEMAEKWLITNR